MSLPAHVFGRLLGVECGGGTGAPKRFTTAWRSVQLALQLANIVSLCTREVTSSRLQLTWIPLASFGWIIGGTVGTGTSGWAGLTGEGSGECRARLMSRSKSLRIEWLQDRLQRAGRARGSESNHELIDYPPRPRRRLTESLLDHFEEQWRRGCRETAKTGEGCLQRPRTPEQAGKAWTWHKAKTDRQYCSTAG